MERYGAVEQKAFGAGWVFFLGEGHLDSATIRCIPSKTARNDFIDSVISADLAGSISAECFLIMAFTLSNLDLAFVINLSIRIRRSFSCSNLLSIKRTGFPLQCLQLRFYGAHRNGVRAV